MVDDSTVIEEIEPSVVYPDGHSQRAIAYFPELLPEHTKLLKQAETASKFYIDEEEEGLTQYSIT
jgi:hypothetical protein